jgi:hypothetical protein
MHKKRVNPLVLPSWEPGDGEDWLGKWAMNLMRANRTKWRCCEWVHRQPC